MDVGQKNCHRDRDNSMDGYLIVVDIEGYINIETKDRIHHDSYRINVTPPISIFSNATSRVVLGFAMVSSNGYKFTATY